jgi:hypothetical protein
LVKIHVSKETLRQCLSWYRQKIEELGMGKNEKKRREFVPADQLPMSSLEGTGETTRKGASVCERLARSGGLKGKPFA